MHQLQRGQAPICLKNFKHGANNWDDVTHSDKTAIWSALEGMQGRRCAYCEGPISEGNRHIEHFHQKGRDPTLTFAWDNLFGSCNRKESCGKHKDRCAPYPPTIPIKPDIEDPERYLVFSPDGSISPRKNISATEQHRATQTIRLFNLDQPLQQTRRREIAGYIQTAEAFAEMAQHFPENEWMPLLQQEIAATAHLPYATAIKHVLTRQG